MAHPLPICPRCRSTSVETTTLGYSGHPENDPNRATCGSCKHTGNLGDWIAIQHAYDALWAMVGCTAASEPASLRGALERMKHLAEAALASDVLG